MRKKKRVFTPNQIGASTFLTGPISGTLFLWLNAKSQGDSSFARIVLVVGTLVFFGLAAYLLLLPEDTGSLPIVLLNTLLAYLTATKKLSRAEINARKEYEIVSVGVVSRLSILMAIVCFVLLMVFSLLFKLYG